MQLSRQAVVSVLFVASILLGGILFWPIIFNEIITPAALVVWLFLRVFVLSIDQKYYWGAIIIIEFVFLLRLPPLGAAPVPSDEHPEANEAIETIRYWRSIFTLTDVSAHDEKILKQELVHLVAALYASKQRVLPGFYSMRRWSEARSHCRMAFMLFCSRMSRRKRDDPPRDCSERPGSSRENGSGDGKGRRRRNITG